MSEEIGPASFFQSTSRAFGETISARRTRPELVALLCAQAFDSFTKNVAIQAEGDPALACHGECAGCCRLRVVATAPEVFLLARFISVNAAAFAETSLYYLDFNTSPDKITELNPSDIPVSNVSGDPGDTEGICRKFVVTL